MSPTSSNAAPWQGNECAPLWQGDRSAPLWRMARRAERMNPSVIREILKLTEKPGVISLAGRLPAPDSFPVEAMREATARVLRDNPREALQYASSEGFAPLLAQALQADR